MPSGPEKPLRRYALDQSPLFKLTTVRKLVQLLGWHGTPAELRRFVARMDNYLVFPIEGREVQQPKNELERLHRRIANLLIRAIVPDYLHSGIKGRSFVSNGEQHTNDMPGIKLDVRKFYPSTTWEHVYRWFRYDMVCNSDVAWLLASICCFQKRFLPTGSCLSQILAFHVHRRMFDGIEKYALDRGGVITIYVDDIFISMPHVSNDRIRQVGRFIELQGLQWHKEKLYPRGVPKLVTGTIAKIGRLEAPNRQHQKLRETLDTVEAAGVGTLERSIAVSRAGGISDSIAQVDRSRRAFSRGLKASLKQSSSHSYE